MIRTIGRLSFVLPLTLCIGACVTPAEEQDMNAEELPSLALSDFTVGNILQPLGLDVNLCNQPDGCLEKGITEKTWPKNWKGDADVETKGASPIGIGPAWVVEDEDLDKYQSLNVRIDDTNDGTATDFLDGEDYVFSIYTKFGDATKVRLLFWQLIPGGSDRRTVAEIQFLNEGEDATIKLANGVGGGIHGVSIEPTDKPGWFRVAATITYNAGIALKLDLRGDNGDPSVGHATYYANPHLGILGDF